MLRHGGLSLDLRTRRICVDGRVVDLTAREFVLAECFLRNAGQVLSREQLLSHVWRYDFHPGSNIVDVYVRCLRNKLGRAHIETVRGMGYRLADPPARPDGEAGGDPDDSPRDDPRGADRPEHPAQDA